MWPILLQGTPTQLCQVPGVILNLPLLLVDRLLWRIPILRPNVVLRTEELEACIEVFLEEAEEDMEMNDLPPLENVTPLLVPAPAIPGFVPFAMSTGQHHIPPKSLLRKVYHPYKDPVGWCCCEPGGWCHELPCSGWIWHVPYKIWGCSSLNGGSRLGRFCCSTDEEPCDQSVEWRFSLWSVQHQPNTTY